jgi:pimeloyl-ACP methyl ester carboxylesterase
VPWGSATAAGIAELLEDGDHLVGWSYGGVVAMLAATRRPDVLGSLAVLDPPAFGIVRGDAVVEQGLTEFEEMHQRYAGDPEQWACSFAGWVRCRIRGRRRLL